MKTLIAAILLATLLSTSMAFAFELPASQPIKGTEGPDVRHVAVRPVKGVEGPDVRHHQRERLLAGLNKLEMP